ncbi:MAG: hypothetical protein PHU85_09780 [Phycisphaerae bacterium]|nr:hypothetical protein [Phycisphaerae bacterium]
MTQMENQYTITDDFVLTRLGAGDSPENVAESLGVPVEQVLGIIRTATTNGRFTPCRTSEPITHRRARHKSRTLLPFAVMLLLTVVLIVAICVWLNHVVDQMAGRAADAAAQGAGRFIDRIFGR